MSRRILAIESATDWLSVALLDGDEAIASESGSARMQHASALLPAIDSVLLAGSCGLRDLEGIAVSTGPGSFTSLRIGIATIKGLAFRSAVPTLGVSTLEAMALAGAGAPASAGGEGEGAEATGHEILTLLDARRGEWYAGSWVAAASAAGAGGVCLESRLAEGLYSPEVIAAQLSGPVVIRAPDAGNWEAAFEASGVKIRSVVRGEAAQPDALWVGRLAAARFDQGAGAPASALTARYVRRAEAEAKRLGGPVEAGEVARLGSPDEGG